MYLLQEAETHKGPVMETLWKALNFEVSRVDNKVSRVDNMVSKVDSRELRYTSPASNQRKHLGCILVAMNILSLTRKRLRN